MRKFIKKYLGEIIVVIGSGIFAYNVLNFSYSKYNKIGGGLLPALPSFGGKEIGGVAYYYHPGTLLLIAIGAMLIVMGVLIIRNKE